MTSYLDLPIGDKTTQLITAVIEIRQSAYQVLQAAHSRYLEKHAAV
jgi:hypothetical protein